jgi:hypothetical protein
MLCDKRRRGSLVAQLAAACRSSGRGWGRLRGERAIAAWGGLGRAGAEDGWGAR